MRLLALVTLIGALALQVSPYRADVEKFRRARAEAIGAETGWIALTDLYWLDKTGEFTIGRDRSNAIALNAPSAPAKLGVLYVTATGVELRPATGGRIELQPNRPVSEAFAVGAMKMSLIERARRRAVRVWDAKGAARVAFTGLHWMPIDEKWRIDAAFVPHDPAPILKIQNIIGQTVEMKNPGAAVFTTGGREVRLEALLEEPDAEELFFMFKDGTSGKTTYGAGRYLYTPLPKDGKVTIDFNRAINPPCAFTDFATCPLPPPANRLSVPIRAGELDYAH